MTIQDDFRTRFNDLQEQFQKMLDGDGFPDVSFKTYDEYSKLSFELLKEYATATNQTGIFRVPQDDYDYFASVQLLQAGNPLKSSHLIVLLETLKHLGKFNSPDMPYLFYGKPTMEHQFEGLLTTITNEPEIVQLLDVEHSYSRNKMTILSKLMEYQLQSRSQAQGYPKRRWNIPQKPQTYIVTPDKPFISRLFTLKTGSKPVEVTIIDDVFATLLRVDPQPSEKEDSANE